VSTPPHDRLDRWYDALIQRHAGDLTFRELRRGLQALSTVYVERRESLTRGAALDGAGKRAAFATFYAPLHYAVTRHVVQALGAASPPPSRIYDLGCGTGAAGAAWAIESGNRPPLTGFDLNPWAIEETRWTWNHFGLDGSVHRRRLEQLRPPARNAAVLVAFTVNELRADSRDGLLEQLIAVACGGGRALVVEPIARRAVRWWDEWAAHFREAGGRVDLWRFAAQLPDGWRQLDRAAGLDHRELTARSLYLAPKCQERGHRGLDLRKGSYIGARRAR